MGDCLADKMIKMVERDNLDVDIYSNVDLGVILSNVDKSRYWNSQHLMYTEYLEYVRYNFLSKDKSYLIRWLNFKVKKKLHTGERYKIIISMKYEEDVSFKAFYMERGILNICQLKI